MVLSCTSIKGSRFYNQEVVEAGLFRIKLWTHSCISPLEYHPIKGRKRLLLKKQRGLFWTSLLLS